VDTCTDIIGGLTPKAGDTHPPANTIEIPSARLAFFPICIAFIIFSLSYLANRAVPKKRGG